MAISSNDRRSESGNGSRPFFRWVRFGLVVTGLLVLVLWFGAQLAARFFVTDDLLRREILHIVQDNTGYRVKIEGEAKLEFRPMPTIRLENVTVLPSDEADPAPILKAAAILAQMDLIATLTGRPALSSVALINANLHFASDSSGHNNLEVRRPQQPNAQTAPVFQPAPQSAPPEPSVSEQPDFPVKELVFTNSSLEVLKDGEATVSIENAGGRLSWPGFNEKLSFGLTADYRGKTLSVTGETASAKALIQGGMGPLAFSVRSKFLNADFKGNGNFSAKAFLDGDFTFESNKLPDLFEWLGDPMHAPVPLNSIEVAAKLKTSGTSLTLAGLELTVDDVPARGAIEIGLPPGGIPSLTGTLAFDTFDIYGFLSTFTPIPVGPGGQGKKIDGGFLRQLKLDLRLSATKASYGPINLAGMAASARIEDHFASFDIAAARIADASVTARLTLDERHLPKRTATLRLDTGRINLGVLAKTLKMVGPLPDARGNISAELNADLPFWAAAPSDISGMVRISTGAGNIRNFDAKLFRQAAAQGDFFNLSDLSDGSMPYQKLDFDTRIRSGVVEVVNAEVTGEENNLSFRGILPYRNQSLALYGKLSSARADQEDVHFFAGGAWPDIVITPGSKITSPAPDAKN